MIKRDTHTRTNSTIISSLSRLRPHLAFAARTTHIFHGLLSHQCRQQGRRHHQLLATLNQLTHSLIDSFFSCFVPRAVVHSSLVVRAPAVWLAGLFARWPLNQSSRTVKSVFATPKAPPTWLPYLKLVAVASLKFRHTTRSIVCRARE